MTEREQTAGDTTLDEADLGDLLSKVGVGRRSVVRALGIGAGAAALSGVGEAARGPLSEPPMVHPVWGYNALSPESVSGAIELRVDHTVTLRGHAPTVRDPPEPPFDFIFDPVGLHVQPGAYVQFSLPEQAEDQPPVGEHTTTAYHDARQRQRRVPPGVPPFSSPMHGPGMSWVYQFDVEGVYDVFCAPHEDHFGMVMRLVVGDGDYEGYGLPDEPVGPFGFAREVFDKPEMTPSQIQKHGSVTWTELFED